MSASKTIYRNVSNNAGAAMQAQRDPAARVALLNAGFTPIGLIEADASHSVTAQVHKHVRQQPNGEEMLALLEHGQVVELFTSPDQRAFAWVEPFLQLPLYASPQFLMMAQLWKQQAT